MNDLALVPLGILAGLFTTLAGLGGGVMLVVVLSALYDPRFALTVTAPALLVGNLHRAIHYREAIDLPIAKSFALGAVPGAFLFGLLAVRLPEVVLSVLLVGTTLLAFAKASGLVDLRPNGALVGPAGFVIGGVAATSGGGPLLASPLLLASGLAGESYVSTGAVCALSMHVGRLAAYGLGGIVTARVIAVGALLSLSILGGNLLGSRLRKHLTPVASRRIELGVLGACVVLALVGVGL